MIRQNLNSGESICQNLNFSTEIWKTGQFFWILANKNAHNLMLFHFDSNDSAIFQKTAPFFEFWWIRFTKIRISEECQNGWKAVLGNFFRGSQWSITSQEHDLRSWFLHVKCSVKILWLNGALIIFVRHFCEEIFQLLSLSLSPSCTLGCSAGLLLQKNIGVVCCRTITRAKISRFSLTSFVLSIMQQL